MAAEPQKEPTVRRVFRWVAAGAFVLAGINHFVMPAMYMKIIPPQLPRPDVLNWVSGLAEIAGGVGLLIPQLRRAAAWGLIALLVAVFPANIYAAIYHIMPGPESVGWIRLPFQFLFLAWVWWVGLKRP